MRSEIHTSRLGRLVSRRGLTVFSSSRLGITQTSLALPSRSVGLPSSCPKIFQNPYLFTTVQPSGMPLVPVGIWPASEPCTKLAALVNVPVEATPDTQSFKQPDADISVASIVMLLRFVQP